MVCWGVFGGGFGGGGGWGGGGLGGVGGCWGGWGGGGVGFVEVARGRTILRNEPKFTHELCGSTEKITFEAER